MALVECRECGGKVSTGADACPHCGAKNFYRPPWAMPLMFLMLLFSIGATLYHMSSAGWI